MVTLLKTKIVELYYYFMIDSEIVVNRTYVSLVFLYCFSIVPLYTLCLRTIINILRTQYTRYNTQYIYLE